MEAVGYAYATPGAGFEPTRYELPDPDTHQAIIKVAGCGLCHTDVGFYYGDVKPRHETPLVLGHEISGTVVSAGFAYESMVGKKVIVPSVIPCGECEYCQSGHENSCPHQFMPGNDGHGGFADHILIPAKGLALLPDDLDDDTLANLSVVADAVTTPYQSLYRARVALGDLVVVIGVGGIGTHAVQLAKAMGAKVIAIDIDDEKLDAVKNYGAAARVNVKGQSVKEAKGLIKATAKEIRAPGYGWKIFEMSGTAAGQELAFNLVNAAGTLAIVGFTMDKVNVRLSNLMAFDATCFGNWGCTPELYPKAIDMVLKKKIFLEPFVERHPLSEINDLFEKAHHGELKKRAVLCPA